jgi:hypothetical protein
MTRFVLVLVALALPALAGAEEMWRWRDAAGKLHYSNVKANVPADAEPVRTRLGRLEGTPAPMPAIKKAEEVPSSILRRPFEKAWPLPQEVGACTSPYGGYFCPRLAIPQILTIQGRNLADQVQEAALLDALRVPWRNGLCP